MVTSYVTMETLSAEHLINQTGAGSKGKGRQRLERLTHRG